MSVKELALVVAGQGRRINRWADVLARWVCLMFGLCVCVCVCVWVNLQWRSITPRLLTSCSIERQSWLTLRGPTHLMQYDDMNIIIIIIIITFLMVCLCSLSLPTQPSSSVPDGPLHTSFWRFPPASCARPAVTNCPYTTLPAQHVRPSAVFCCWPDRLELSHCPKTFGSRSVVLTVTDGRWRHFYFHSSNVSSAFEIGYKNAPYKFIFDILHFTFWSGLNNR